MRGGTDLVIAAELLGDARPETARLSGAAPVSCLGNSARTS
ncbi:MAG TPA: hypothetical protein VEF89_12300 [Solirubrobacteraceae bacterium]|nr:hypothetical protein [Solirubrobacteraceae bacterium]